MSNLHVAIFASVAQHQYTHTHTHIPIADLHEQVPPPSASSSSMDYPAKNLTHPAACILTTSTLKWVGVSYQKLGYMHDYGQKTYFHACAGDVGVRWLSSEICPKGSDV